jgi:hypothetical protein
MEPVSVDHHTADFRVVEARHNRAVEALVDLVALLLVAGVVHIERVVENDQRRTAADERPSFGWCFAMRMMAGSLAMSRTSGSSVPESKKSSRRRRALGDE